MPAKTEKQRRFMGIVHAIKTGELDPSYSKAAARAARSMKLKSIKHFARKKKGK